MGSTRQAVSSGSRRRAEAPGGDPGSQRLLRALEDIVSHVFEIERERLTQPTRGEAPVAHARQVAMYLAHTGYGLSHTEVGQLFRRDRTTVAHACALVENRRDSSDFDRALDILQDVVRLLAGLDPEPTP